MFNIVNNSVLFAKSYHSIYPIPALFDRTERIFLMKVTHFLLFFYFNSDFESILQIINVFYVFIQFYIIGSQAIIHSSMHPFHSLNRLNKVGDIPNPMVNRLLEECLSQLDHSSCIY